MRQVLATAVLAITVAGNTSVFAQEPSRQEASQTATIPFDPPLNSPLRYRVNRTTSFSQNNTVLEQELTFTRVANGYLLKISTIKLIHGDRTYLVGEPVPMPNRAEDMPFRPEDVFLLQGPITLRLSPTGAVVAVDDWDTVRQRLHQLPESLAAQVPDEHRGRFRDTTAAVVLPMADVSDRTALTFLAKEWPPILMFGGVTLPLGTKLVRTGQSYPLGPSMPVPLTIDVSLARTPSGTLALVSNQVTDKTDLTAAIDRFEQEAAARATSEDGRAARVSQFSSQRGSDRIASTQLEVDSRGILQSGYWETRAVRDGTVVRFDRTAFELVN